MSPRGGRVAAALLGAALALAGCGRPAGRTSAVRRPATAAALPAPCLILVAPHGKDAFVADAGAQVRAPRCELHVDSDEMFYSATLKADSRLDVAALCVAGDIARRGGLVSEPRRECSANVDRFHRPPPPEASAPCGPPPRIDAAAVVLQPGVYCGGLDLRGPPRVTFAPGQYVIRGGDLTFDGGEARGAGVSFFFADASRPVFRGDAVVDLAPPTGGPRAGVLMDEAAGLPPSGLEVGAARLHLDGLLHLPSRRAVFADGSRLESDRLLLVLQTAVLHGTDWTLGGPWRPQAHVSGLDR